MNVLKSAMQVLGLGVSISMLVSAQSISTAEQIPVTPAALPAALAASISIMGNRMATAEKAQSSLTGTITDSKGSRPAEIIVQAPSYLSYREGESRAVVFDGVQSLTKVGALTSDDQSILESLLSDSPDSISLQVASGGSFRRVGSHFRVDDGRSKNYTGPYLTVIAFDPGPRAGLAKGSALQRQIFISIDESSGLMSEVRTVETVANKQTKVTQTQFTNWIQQGEQWFPGKIVRLENGVTTLSFQTRQARTGLAGNVALFKP